MKLGDMIVRIDEEKKEIKKLFITYVIIIAIVAAIAVTIAIAMYINLMNYQKDLNERLLVDERYLHKNGANISQIQEYFNSKGIIYKMIETGNFLENSYSDIDEIVTNLMMKYHFSNSNFFRIYVAGKQPIWFQISKNGKVVFSKTLKPGLNDYYFFVTEGGTSTYSNYSIPLGTTNFTVTTADYKRLYVLLKLKKNFYMTSFDSKTVDFSEFIKKIQGTNN